MKAWQFVSASSVLFTAAACSSEVAPAPAMIVEDSAGIRIVTYHSLAETPAWTLDAVPTLTVGVASGEHAYEFSGIVGAAVHHGRLIIADGSSSELRVFDEEGSHVETISGRGAGPGEFERLAWLAVVDDDSIYAWDSSLARLTVFDSQLTFIRSQLPLVSQSAPAAAFGMADARTLLLNVLSSNPGPPPVDQISNGNVDISVVQLGDDSAPRTIIEVAGRPVYRRSGGSILAVPFTTLPGYAAASSTVFVGNGGQHEIRRVSIDGTVDLILRLPSAGAVTTVHIAAARETYLASVPPQDQRDRASLFDRVPLPDSLPSFDIMRLGSGGQLWVRSYTVSGSDTQTWTVFDNAGIARGHIELPINLQVMSIYADRIVCRSRDVVGVERITVYEYHRSR